MKRCIVLAHHFWTTGDIALLRANGHLGAQECASIIGVSVAAVKAAAVRHRVSLRMKGSRRGIVMGQPRGVSLRGEVHDLLVGKRRDEVIAQRMKLSDEEDLCPCCVVRPVRVRSTGFCLTCHLRRLAELHDEAASDAEALRRLDAARQRKKAALDAMSLCGDRA